MKIRKAFAAFAVFAMCLIFVSPLLAGIQTSSVKVMTRNMYPGANLDIFADIQSEQDFYEAVAITAQSISDSKIPERAAGIAAEIAETKPDLVAIQEATTWTIRSETETTTIDQLDLLMTALAASGQHYKIALVQTLTDVDMGLMAYTDHNVILVRSDVPCTQLNILGKESHYL
jgi:hypothetical protein